MAFGGPNAHIGIMSKMFVEDRKDVTSQELTDIFSFCQLLPGPSSSQTITLIGYKRGGLKLALLTLLIWMAPATIIMGALAIGVHFFNINNKGQFLFEYVQPMALGFLFYAAYMAMKKNIKYLATFMIMLVACGSTFLFRSPWVFPILLVVGGFVSNLSDHRIPTIAAKPKKINWNNIYLFLVIFIIAAVLSELARTNHWANARYFNLFENFYRFGSFTWGGGHALAPLLYEQFISLPVARGGEALMSRQDFLTGFGMMNCIPGPVFSISSYIGGMSMANYGIVAQIIGSLLASLAIFLPSTLLVFFLYPIYNNLKQHTIIFRALEGIYAVVIGLMWASGIILFTSTYNTASFEIMPLVVILITIVLLLSKKVAAPWIVLLALAIGAFKAYII
jgi:chromate transporter